MYICTSQYTDGTHDIWTEVMLSNTFSWVIQ
jgi:hypothetical protein